MNNQPHNKRAEQLGIASLAGLLLITFFTYSGRGTLPTQMLIPWARITTLVSGWFMHLFGMHVWADGDVLRTDLYAYVIPEGYHGAGVMLVALGMAAGVAIWRRHHFLEAGFLAASSVAGALFWNVVRITLLIRFGPAPASAAISGLLRDTTIIVMILTIINVGLNLLLVESARYIRQQRIDPLPGAASGALSEFPPFWHRVLRRYRHTYILIPTLAIFAAVSFAARPARRTAILSELVADMTAQHSYVHALRLGHHVASRRPDDTAWQLRLIRILLLATKPDQALEALDDLSDTALPEHIREIHLLRTHAHILRQDWPQARSLWKTLQQQASADPIWKMIFLEIALALGDQQAVLHWAPQAVQTLTQAPRIQPALPLLQNSGRGDILLRATQWMSWNTMEFPLFHSQIMALLQTGRVSDAAERTQFALQRWPAHHDMLIPTLLLTRVNQTEWEPRLARLLKNITEATDSPEKLLAIVHVSFALNRPDLAWPAYRRMRQQYPQSPHAKLALATHAENWFLFHNHYLRLPAATPGTITDVLPLAVLGQHVPFFQSIANHIPHADELPRILEDKQQWQDALRETALQALENALHARRQSPQLQLDYARLLETEGHLEQAHQECKTLALQHPDWSPLANYHQARLEQQAGNPWQAYARQRTLIFHAPALAPEHMLPWQQNWPPRALPPEPQTAHQLPLLIQLVDLLWNNRLPITALYTSREALQRFPDDPVIRTIAADIMLQLAQPEHALHLLENTTIRRSPATDALEAEALLATERFTELPTFRRQRLLSPASPPPEHPPSERLTPAEALLTPFAKGEITIIAPPPESPIYPLFEQARAHPEDRPDFTMWLMAADTRIEQAENMYLLTMLLHEHRQPEWADQAARLAVMANPHEPILWKTLLRGAPDAGDILDIARSFCPDDPDLWLAQLVWISQTTQRNQTHTHRRQHILLEARENAQFPVETLVRAADFLWRGEYYQQAIVLINLYHGRERGLLAAHLLGVEAAEYTGNRGRALYHIEAAIEAAGEAAPELYARFIRSKIQAGQIDSDSNVIHALRQLRQAEPDNTFWTELLGFVRYTRGGSDIREGSFEMRNAIQAGSTNRLAFLIAADGLRHANRAMDAAGILQQGLAIHPEDPVMINNLAYILAENPDTAPQAAQWIATLIPMADENPEIRDTLAFVLLRNNDLEAARELLSRNLREAPPDSRIWFRSQMHLAELLWRQGRTQVAASMLEQLLHGARNIADEDLLAANRLLVHIRTSP